MSDATAAEMEAVLDLVDVRQLHIIRHCGHKAADPEVRRELILLAVDAYRRGDPGHATPVYSPRPANERVVEPRKKDPRQR